MKRVHCVVCLWAHYGVPPARAKSLEGDCEKNGEHGEIATALAIMFFGDERPWQELAAKLIAEGGA